LVRDTGLLKNRRFLVAEPPWRASLFAALLLGATFLAIRSDTAAGMTLKFLFAKLVYSTSDGAVLFLLGFSAIALLCRYLNLSLRWSAMTSLLTWAGLSIGYGMHLVATVAYHVEHRIPFSAHVYHWSAGVNSYSALQHSHLGKAAMARFSWLLPDQVNYDAGGALADAVPPVLAWTISLAFLAALTGALLRMPAFQRAYGHRPALTIAYLIAATTAVKSIFDGGVLAYAVPPSLVLLWSFFFNRDEHEWLHFWRARGPMIGVVLLAGYASFWIGLTPDDSFPLLGPWLFVVAVLILLMTVAWRGITAWLGRSVLLAYLLVNCAFDYGDNLEPLLRKPTVDYRVATFDIAGNWTLQPIDQLRDLPVFKIYQALGDDPWKPRKTLLWKDSTQGSTKLGASIRLLDWSTEHGSLAPIPALRIASIAIADNDWIDVEVATTTAALPPLLTYGIGNALTKNNYYVWLYQVDLLLRKAGWQSYVLLPHTSGNILAHAGM
jgi:hypothetical protein